jgi:hypothetical protein
LIIIRIQKDLHFEVVKKLKKLSSFINNYRFYEGDKLLEDNHIIKKGVHYIQYRSQLKGGNNNIMIKISSTILTTHINSRQEMFYLYRLVATWACMNISDFTIQGENHEGRRCYLSLSDTIFPGQFRMLVVNFIPYQHRNEPIFIDPLDCENLVKFNIANEMGIYTTITVNGLLKIRTLKKILKFHFAKEGKWPIIELFDDKYFNDFTQLDHFRQFTDTISVKF